VEVEELMKRLAELVGRALARRWLEEREAGCRDVEAPARDRPGPGPRGPGEPTGREPGGEG
jgi:hypothetical protein